MHEPVDCQHVPAAGDGHAGCRQRVRSGQSAPSQPKIAGVVGRFSTFIHLRTLSFACFSGPIEPDTSVNFDICGERLPKSLFSASEISS